MQAELTHDAANARAFPHDELPEVAVLGRSNVGKSTFINALVGRRGLARTSARPGKTRRIHFYRLEEAAYLVDLPGFGYAAVAREERAAWRPLVEAYLRGKREALRGAVLLVDLRRGPEDEELDLLAWLDAEGIERKLALTKRDKLRPGEVANRTQAIRTQLRLPPADVATVSARTGQGLRSVGAWLEHWLGVAFRRPDGSPLLG